MSENQRQAILLPESLGKQLQAFRGHLSRTKVMESLGIAFQRLDLSKRIKVSKTIYGWNNTGTQRKKEPAASSACPRCGEQQETQEHVVRCKAGSACAARYNALVKLYSAVSTRVGSSQTWTTLIACLRYWLETGNGPTILQVDTTSWSGEALEMLVTTMESQEKIGWQYTHRGILASGWTVLQAKEQGQSIHTARCTWSPRVIHACWIFTDTMWQHRNETLHANLQAT
jgi:hypothetical protein